jgi:ATP-dependent DNA helicase DinG
LEQRGLDAFRSVQLPQAVLALKQGIGRLIRDHHDYGVVMIGDRRLRTKGYGKVVLKALPPMPLVDDFESARQFLLAHRQRYIHLRKT